MKKYKVRFKLISRDHITEATCSGSLSKKVIVEFLGLDKGDVEWYEVEEVKDEK